VYTRQRLPIYAYTYTLHVASRYTAYMIHTHTHTRTRIRDELNLRAINEDIKTSRPRASAEIVDRGFVRARVTALASSILDLNLESNRRSSRGGNSALPSRMHREIRVLEEYLEVSSSQNCPCSARFMIFLLVRFSSIGDTKS